MRMEPPPSLAWAAGTIPDATAAAAPPLAATGGIPGVPGFPGCAFGDWFGGQGQAKFRGVGFAQHHQAGVKEALHNGAVGCRYVSLV